MFSPKKEKKNVAQSENTSYSVLKCFEKRVIVAGQDSVKLYNFPITGFYGIGVCLKFWKGDLKWFNVWTNVLLEINEFDK